MLMKHVMNCSFPSWYPLFRKNTMKSIILPLPENFIQYLLADGLVLPNSDDHKYSAPPPVKENDEEESEVDWSTADTDEAQVPNFPEFDEEIRNSIEELGGYCFPKLNWSSPRDATWIALNNSLCCRNVSDIYLLLKSSDFIMHDLTEPFKFCTDENCRTSETFEQTEGLPNSSLNDFKVSYVLILRKWVEIDPSTEFRCFVRDNKIIGISQRDYTSFYAHIGSEKACIIQDIVSFFQEHIQNKFLQSNYTFDVYRKKKDVVRLVDFNPFGEVSNPLLFDWSELETAPNCRTDMQHPEFRYVTCYRGIQPSPYSLYARPKDIVDLATGQDPYKLIDLLQLKMNIQRNEEPSVDEEDPVVS